MGTAVYRLMSKCFIVFQSLLCTTLTGYTGHGHCCGNALNAFLCQIICLPATCSLSLSLSLYLSQCVCVVCPAFNCMSSLPYPLLPFLSPQSLTLSSTLFGFFQFVQVLPGKIACIMKMDIDGNRIVSSRPK